MKQIDDLGNYFIQKIVNATIRSIQKNGGEGMHIREYTVLKNHWDEICVQVQYESFLNWDLYEEMIKVTVSSLVEEQDYSVQYLITYLAEQELNGRTPEESSYYPELCQEFLKKKALDAATNYRNSRIRKYLDNSYLD